MLKCHCGVGQQSIPSVKTGPTQRRPVVIVIRYENLENRVLPDAGQTGTFQAEPKKIAAIVDDDPSIRKRAS